MTGHTTPGTMPTEVAPEEQEPTSPDAVAPRTIAARTRLVIADDEALIRMDLRQILTGLGYLVIGEAADGQTAVHLARETRPDVVIMDIKMPHLDGLAAARQLTAEGIAPVILLTAYSQRDLVAQAVEAGVINYLVKPFRDADLPPAIEVALATFAAFTALHAVNTDLKDNMEGRKVIERAKGVLMDRQGLQEAEAFRRMQKLAMDSRKSMKDVASAVLLAHQI